MIERVARAMCNDLGVNPDDWHEEDGVRVYAWQKEASTARAAIEAVRELTLKQRYIGGDKLRALAKELRALRPTFAQNGQEKGWVSAPAKDLERAEAIDALLSELEAVKGENARLYEANVMIREQQKEDFTRAQAAEAALASLKEERGSSSVSLRAAPDGANETQHFAGLWRSFDRRRCTIQAYQFREQMIVAHLLDDAPLPPGVRLGHATYHKINRTVSSWRASVHTMHDQSVYLTDGDWIVPEPVEGRFYPVKPDVFEARYCPAESGASSPAEGRAGKETRDEP